MTESTFEPAPDEHEQPEQSTPEPTAPERTAPERTGHEQVDAVVDEVATLEDLPVAEHVAVFERAHDTLRRTLEARPSDA